MKGSLVGATAAALVAAACPGLFVGPDASLDQTALFEYVWSDVDRHYALFTVKSVDWDSLHEVYAPRASQAPSDSALADVVGAMLSELRDFHVNLFTPPRSYGYTGHTARPAFFDPGVVGYYVTDRGVAPNGHMVFGRAAPDIGYVWILHFARSGFGVDIDTALARLADVRAMIIDVRDNPGGDHRNALAVAGRFADRPRTYGFVRFRNGPRHDDLTQPESRVVSPAGGRHFSGPVVVLTNRKSMSAAEGFVMAMGVLPTVTIVGDSTAGGSGNPLARELPNGWTYRFSVSLWYDAAHMPFEEVGLAPNVWVRGSAEELAARRDAALDTALAVVRRALP